MRHHSQKSIKRDSWCIGSPKPDALPHYPRLRRRLYISLSLCTTRNKRNSCDAKRAGVLLQKMTMGHLKSWKKRTVWRIVAFNLHKESALECWIHSLTHTLWALSVGVCVCLLREVSAARDPPAKAAAAARRWIAGAISTCGLADASKL